MRATALNGMLMLLALSSQCWAQNCVITGTTNYGTINQNCIIVGPAKLGFDPAIAAELAKKLPAGKPLHVTTIGRQADQDIAVQYLEYLKDHGFQIAERNLDVMALPQPEHPITYADAGAFVQLIIAPDAH
jgi:hypothetical protein